MKIVLWKGSLILDKDELNVWAIYFVATLCGYYYMGFLDIVGLKYNPGIAYVNIFNDGRVQ